MKYTPELLSPIIARSRSWAEVCRELGVVPMTGSQTHVKKRAIDFHIDFGHFLGQGWNKGNKHQPKKPLTYYLRDGFPYAKSHDLRLRLIREGIKNEECEQCGITEWCGNKVPLELDHINSNHFDNRLKNLKIVCPNCHANKKYTYGFIA